MTLFNFLATILRRRPTNKVHDGNRLNMLKAEIPAKQSMLGKLLFEHLGEKQVIYLFSLRFVDSTLEKQFQSEKWYYFSYIELVRFCSCIILTYMSFIKMSSFESNFPFDLEGLSYVYTIFSLVAVFALSLVWLNTKRQPYIMIISLILFTVGNYALGLLSVMENLDRLAQINSEILRNRSSSKLTEYQDFSVIAMRRQMQLLESFILIFVAIGPSKLPIPIVAFFSAINVVAVVVTSWMYYDLERSFSFYARLQIAIPLVSLYTIWSVEYFHRKLFWIKRTNQQLRSRRTLSSFNQHEDKLDSLGVRHIGSSQIEMLEQIGKGNFGIIYKGKFSGDTVAIKKMSKDRLDTELQKDFIEEITTVSTLQHPNIICVYGACWKESIENTFLVLEHAENGTFEDILANPNYGWKDCRQTIILGLAKGMRYLHHGLNKPIVHRDLKPANILISSAMEAKITDFGTARIVPHLNMTKNDNIILTNDVGTRLFMAPEIVNHEFYNEKVDVYAFGLILLEALVGDGNYLINAHTVDSTRQKADDNLLPPIPNSTRIGKAALVNLVEQCCQKDPFKRPTFIEIADILINETPVDHKTEVKNKGISGRNRRENMGRSFDVSSTSIEEVKEIVKELQIELKNRDKEHNQEMEKLKNHYEEKLSSMASAIF